MTKTKQERRPGKRSGKKPPALAYLGWILFGLSKLPDAARVAKEARRSRLQKVSSS